MVTSNESTGQDRSLSTEESDLLDAWRLPYPTTPYDIWTRTNAGEVFPNVVTPLTWSIYRALGERLLKDAERVALIPRTLFRDGRPPLIFSAINGRLWYNAGLMHHIATERFGLPSWFYSLSLGGPQEGERLHLPIRELRALRLVRAAPGIMREQRRQERAVRSFERDAAAMRVEATSLRCQDLSGMDMAGLLARLERIAGRAFAP